MTTDEPQLVPPGATWAGAFAGFVGAFRDAGEAEHLGRWEAGLADLPAFLRMLADEAAGRNLPEGFVPQSTFWLVVAGEIVGEIRIRHALTPALADFGGHIGYAVRPDRRRRGHGARMLALALDEARTLGLKRVLITCDPDNAGSVRVIERNGGRPESESVSSTGRLTRRYRIEL